MSQPAAIEYEPWALEVRSIYDRRESATFVLHDNIADIFPLQESYLGARQYVEAMLDVRDYIIVGYDVSRGMRFYREADAREFLRLANLGRNESDPLIRSVYDFPQDARGALSYIEALTTGIDEPSRPIAVVLDFADQIAPSARGNHLSEAERTNVVTLQRLARLFYDRLQESSLRDAVLFMLVPNLHDLHADVVSSEYVATICIPRPDAQLRHKYAVRMGAYTKELGRPVEVEGSVDRLVGQTAGLTLTGIRHIFLRAAQGEQRTLGSEDIFERKRELLLRDSRGMLDIIAPSHGMDAVGGHASIKTMLTATASDLKAGLDDVPVGIVFPGPNGVGKTFIAKAFARDSGLNCVALKNFRGMYVGQTESNLELIFNILTSMTPNVVIVDEADKMLGNERSDGTSGVDERVFGALTAFMGDPNYRGKIFWLLLTARPFDLAPDTGRPGRVEEHVPILPPTSLDDRRAVLEAVARARGVRLLGRLGRSLSDSEYEEFFGAVGTITPAAIELIVNRARRVTRRNTSCAEPLAEGALDVDFEIALSEARNYVPDGTDQKLRLQTLEAVLYTNHLNYLPEEWQARVTSAPEELAKERALLRLELGYN